MRKRHVLGLALSALVAIPLAGSQASNAATSVDQSTVAVVQPSSDVLAAAVARTRSVDLSFEATVGDARIGGVYDSKSGAAGFHYNSAVAVTTADAMYPKDLDDNLPQQAWVHVNTAMLAASCELASIANPVEGLSLLAAATSTEQVGPSDFRGTFDLTRVTGSPATMKNAEYFAAITTGDRAAVAFTATVDRTGFVSAMTSSFRVADGEFVYDLRLSNFGISTPVKIPTSGVVEAPSYWYV